MASKTANVLARIEPEVKEQAEEILDQLGIPASVVINMLYKQIILKKGIPFSVSLNPAPKSIEQMNIQEFDSMMLKGLEQAKANDSRPAEEVFADLKREMKSFNESLRN